MWREIVGEFESAELRSGVDAGVLDRIEVELSQPIPRDLRSFLIESNGLEDEYGTEIVWSAERILDDNRSFRGDEQYRSLYMAFDPLLFFGDNGGGDQFAYVRKPERDGVFVWDHETDSRNLVSPGLESYVRSALASDGEDWYRTE
ncbi:SMI1/KNR4 family protein [Streptomyces sp. NBC_01281]|uniref:SMI1/KNR4 family protein n=1 Tax=Streptomyces sp. NBC_00197 TaxID=2975676 RepID=UPI002E0DE00B|nr:SMI1/KNR4 family protein [Streptomyces sp. NBC_01281]